MLRRWLLGVGTGHCGLETLPEILGQQPGTRFTLLDVPRLPWQRHGAPGLIDRLARWRQRTIEPVVGDAAPFYLPYIEEALKNEPALRVICLERPADEVVSAFCASLNKRPRTPVDHWSRISRPGFEHDPCWSHTYPHYDEPTREAGIRRYCRDYANLSRELAQQFPDRFKIIDTQQLTEAEGVRELLCFCGYAKRDQVLILAKQPTVEIQGDQGPPPHPFPPLDPRRCVVLVPYNGFIHQECDESLKVLERRGYSVRRVSGYSAIDQGRNQMATDSIVEGFEETLWIDSDVGFHPNDVETLRRHQRPMVCGIYPQKGKRALTSHILPGTSSITFGKGGGLVELLYAATGFLLVRREVYLTMQSQLPLPLCNERFGRPTIPYFQPIVRIVDDGRWYLAEDYSFSHRARECGFSIFADTRIRLWHIGNYRYGWEESGFDPRRFESFTLNFQDDEDLPPPPDISGTPIPTTQAEQHSASSFGTVLEAPAIAENET